VEGLTEAEGGDGEPLSPVGKVKGILRDVSQSWKFPHLLPSRTHPLDPASAWGCSGSCCHRRVDSFLPPGHPAIQPAPAARGSPSTRRSLSLRPSCLSVSCSVLGVSFFRSPCLDVSRALVADVDLSKRNVDGEYQRSRIYQVLQVDVVDDKVQYDHIRALWR
jgi:hypothetical protein